MSDLFGGVDFSDSMQKALQDARRAEEEKSAESQRREKERREKEQREMLVRRQSDADVRRSVDLTNKISSISRVASQRAEERKRELRAEEEARIQRLEDEKNAIILPIEGDWEWVTVQDDDTEDMPEVQSPAPQPVNSLIDGIMKRLEYARPSSSADDSTPSSTIGAMEVEPVQLDDDDYASLLRKKDEGKLVSLEISTTAHVPIEDAITSINNNSISSREKKHPDSKCPDQGKDTE